MAKCKLDSFSQKTEIRITFGHLFFLPFLFMMGCFASPSPDFQDLVIIEQPRIFGQTNVDLTSSSVTYNLSGTCDPKSLGTEYSLNAGKTWKFLGLCTTGSFSLDVGVLTATTVFLRALTRFSRTPITKARIVSLAPSTNVVFSLASSSRSQITEGSQPTLSFTMPSFMTGARGSVAGSIQIDLHPTGVTYAP